RLANEIAAAAMEHVARELRPGMKESEAAAIWQGFVHGEGTGWKGKVELAFGFSLVWSGPGIRTFTATGHRLVQRNEPTLFEIWVCADGYWCDHTKNVCPGRLDARYEELLDVLLDVYGLALDHCRPGASLAELDVLIRDGLAQAGYPGQPSHPIAHGVGARAHEPPYAHQAGSGTIEKGMVLAIEPARGLDELGIERIEAGFPRISKDDWRAVELIRDARLNAEVWGFSRAVEADVKALVELGVRASVIESPISDLKLDALGVDREA